MLFHSFYFFCYITILNAVHFNGGTIRWLPVDPSDNSSSIAITIIQTYYWTNPLINCANDVPVSTPGRQSTAVNLTCAADCLTDGGYSGHMITMITDCISIIVSLGILTSQRSVNVTLLANAHFYLSFQGNAWRDLDDPIEINLPWSMVSFIDLRMRSDETINTPPAAIVASPQFASANRTTAIHILVSDANAGDDIRCRWSENFTISATDECGGICYPLSMPNSTTLSNCTLFFWGPTAGVWYAAAIQVEDFINTTSTTPMSSVPVQFLIYVIPTPVCSDAPIVMPIAGCLEVSVNVSISKNISVLNLCDPNAASVTNIIAMQSPSGMSINSIQQSSSNASIFYTTFTWTPQANQLGAQQLCLIAYTNESVQSSEYCVTFTVIALAELCAAKVTNAAVSPEAAAIENNSENQTDWGLIGGLIAMGAALVLCCCCWCCLYCLLWSPAARRRRGQKENDEEKLAYIRQTSHIENSLQSKTKQTIATQTTEIPNENYEVYRIHSATKNEENNQKSASTNTKKAEQETTEVTNMNLSITRSETFAGYSVNKMTHTTTKTRSFVINRSNNEQLNTRIFSTPPFNVSQSNTCQSPLGAIQHTDSIPCDFNDWARIYLFGIEQTSGLPRIQK